MLLHKGEVDGMLCGTWGTTAQHLHYIDQVIGRPAAARGRRTCRSTPA
jgi:malate dehydrogenase (oxaloacetate-decarboxylating)(NADP+)